MHHKIAGTFYEKKKDWKYIIHGVRKEFPENVLKDSDALVEMELVNGHYYQGKPQAIPPPKPEDSITNIPGIRNHDVQQLKALSYNTVQELIDADITVLAKSTEQLGITLLEKYQKACLRGTADSSGVSIREFSIYQVPPEIINGATQYDGAIEKKYPDKQVSEMVDTRKYYTPHDCSKDGECHISYFETINGARQDYICSVPEWIKWSGWKEGKMVFHGQRADTTDNKLDGEAQMLVNKLIQEGEARKAKIK